MVQSHNDDGSIRALIGVSMTTTHGYPLNFIWNTTGKTRNANKWGHYGVRKATNDFLFKALETNGLFTSSGVY